jgi:hypothetical protein
LAQSARSELRDSRALVWVDEAAAKMKLPFFVFPGWWKTAWHQIFAFEQSGSSDRT